MERVNARYPFSLPEPVDLVTIDLSFISLEKVVPNVAKLVKPGGKLICLVKPQFEAGRAQVGKGWLVKNPLLHARVLGRFISGPSNGLLRNRESAKKVSGSAVLPPHLSSEPREIGSSS